MKRKIKQLFAWLLVFAMLVMSVEGFFVKAEAKEGADNSVTYGNPENPRVENFEFSDNYVVDETEDMMFSAHPKGQIVNYKCYEIGEWPQAEVIAKSQVKTYDAVSSHCLEEGDLIISNKLYKQLENSDDWDENNDVVIGEERYHRLRAVDSVNYDYITSTLATNPKRSYGEEYKRLNASNYYWGAGEDGNMDTATYHYFKYEPIKWRLLSTDGVAALLLCDKVIDGQMYDDIEAIEYKQIKSYLTSWKDCTLRAWINDEFYNRALLDASADNKILEDWVIESENDYSELWRNASGDVKSGTNVIKDKVFLPSWEELLDVSHGFLPGRTDCDYARTAHATMYAKAKGVEWGCGNDSGRMLMMEKSKWGIRDISYNNVHGPLQSIVGVKGNNAASEYCAKQWYKTYYILGKGSGIRPAVRLDITKMDLEAYYAGTYSTDGVFIPKSKEMKIAPQDKDIRAGKPAKFKLKHIKYFNKNKTYWNKIKENGWFTNVKTSKSVTWYVKKKDKDRIKIKVRRKNNKYDRIVDVTVYDEEPITLYADYNGRTYTCIINDGYSGNDEEDDEGDFLCNDPIIEPSDSTATGYKVTYDCIWCGSYPQSEVISSELYEEYGKESDTAIVSDTIYKKLEHADWGEEDELVLGNTKYKRISLNDVTYPADNYWHKNKKYRYFLYEPVKWRVLGHDKKKSALIVQADKILDCKDYNMDKAAASTWSSSTLRSWLNGYGKAENIAAISFGKNNFYDTIFSKDVQYSSLSPATYLTNTALKTKDAAFLLSKTEIQAVQNMDDDADCIPVNSFGFCYDENSYPKDEALDRTPSDYAAAMGTEVYDNGKKRLGSWLLRSNILGYSIPYVQGGEGVSSVSATTLNNNTKLGICPVVLMDADAGEPYIRYAGTYCTDGTVQEQNRTETGNGGFDLLTNGYAFSNSAASFGYDAFFHKTGEEGSGLFAKDVGDNYYMTPYARYKEVFGESMTEDMYTDHAELWEGNCFGMVVSAYLFYKNRIHLKDYKISSQGLYQGGNDGNGTLDFSKKGIAELVREIIKNNDAENDRISAFREYFVSCDLNYSEITKLIERYQIWGYECKLPQKIEFSKILSAIEEHPTEPYFLDVSWVDVVTGVTQGHTLLVDSARGIEDVSAEHGGQSWKRIYLYDPNYPYRGELDELADNAEELASVLCGATDEYDIAKMRYIDICDDRTLPEWYGKWQLNVAINSNSSENELGYYTDATVAGLNSEGYFYTMKEIPDFTPESKELASFVYDDKDSTAIRFSCNAFTVKNAKGKQVLEVADGQIFSQDEKKAEVILNTGTSPKSTRIKGRVILPGWGYTVEAATKGVISIESAGIYKGVEVEDGMTLSSTTAGAISIATASGGAVSLIMESNDRENGDYVCLSTEVAVNASPSTFTIDGWSFTAATASKQALSLKVQSSKGDFVVTGSALTDSLAIDLSEYLFMIGEDKPEPAMKPAVTLPPAEDDKEDTDTGRSPANPSAEEEENRAEDVSYIAEEEPEGQKIPEEWEGEDEPSIKTGDRFVYRDAVYTVTNSNTNTVSYTRYQGSAKKVVIPARVSYQGRIYTVTAIGKHALRGCSGVKKICIRTKQLVFVGKKAFQGVRKKTVVIVPKGKKKAYKKLFKRGGLKAKIK